MILVGDVREKLKELADGSVHCVVTSPPYWGLRDYGADGQIGLESTPDEYVASMVAVFREVRRVLRDDATVWLNLGDTYSSHKDCKSTIQTVAKGSPKENAHLIEKGKSVSRNTKLLKSVGLKNKDLIGIPWRVAFALQADGWYLRQDIIWAKPNPMPESVTDRCTKSHEYIFLLSKSARYYYDNEAIKEPTVTRDDTNRDRDSTRLNNIPGRTRMAGLKTNDYEMRNKRDVWTVTTRPYKGAHFATFPPDLITPCILAGCPPDGTVLDPFFGAGTTGLVAQRHNRRWIGIELNPEYAKLAADRIEAETNLFTEREEPLGALWEMFANEETN